MAYRLLNNYKSLEKALWISLNKKNVSSYIFFKCKLKSTLAHKYFRNLSLTQY